MPETKQNIFSNIGTVLAYTAAGMLDPSSVIKMREAANQSELERKRLDMVMRENMSQEALRQSQMQLNQAQIESFNRDGDAVPPDMEVWGYDPKGRPILRKSEEVKSKEANKRKAVEDYRSYKSNAQFVLNALNEVETAAKNLGDFKPGIAEQIGAKAKMGVEGFAKDNPNLNQYMSVISENLIPLARKLMEEKGPITEWDVKRVETALGDKTLPLKDKIQIISRMREKVNMAISQKAENAGVENISDVGTKTTDVRAEYNRLRANGVSAAEAKKQLGL